MSKEELLKLFKPGGISKHSDIQISQRFGGWDKEQRKEKVKHKPQYTSVGNNLGFWQKMIEVIEPKLRGVMQIMRLGPKPAPRGDGLQLL